MAKSDNQICKRCNQLKYDNKEGELIKDLARKVLFLGVSMKTKGDDRRTRSYGKYIEGMKFVPTWRLGGKVVKAWYAAQAMVRTWWLCQFDRGIRIVHIHWCGQRVVLPLPHVHRACTEMRKESDSA